MHLFIKELCSCHLMMSMIPLGLHPESPTLPRTEPSRSSVVTDSLSSTRVCECLRPSIPQIHRPEVYKNKINLLASITFTPTYIMSVSWCALLPRADSLRVFGKPTWRSTGDWINCEFGQQGVSPDLLDIWTPYPPCSSVLASTIS